MFFLPLILLITPLIPALYNFGYEYAKVAFFVLSTSILGLIWLFKTSKAHEPGFPKILRILIIFIAILFLTSLFGINPRNSIFGVAPYFQGVILYAYLLLFAFFVSKHPFPMLKWTILITIASSLVALVAIIQYLQLNILQIQIPTYAGRVVSTFGQPNFFAGYLLINLPFVYHLLNKAPKKFKIWVFLLILTNLLAIIISQSRTSILILAVVLGVWAFKRLSNKIKMIVVILFFASMFGVVFYALKENTGIIYSEIIQPQSPEWLAKNSPEKRIFIWPIFVQLILERPLMGYGMENLKDAYSAYFLKFNPETTQLPPYFFTLKNIVVDRAHNYPMDLLISSGVFGLVGWGVALFYMRKKARTKYIASSLLIYLAWVQFQNQSVVNLIQFWFLAGLISVDRG